MNTFKVISKIAKGDGIEEETLYIKTLSEEENDVEREVKYHYLETRPDTIFYQVLSIQKI